MEIYDFTLNLYSIFFLYLYIFIIYLLPNNYHNSRLWHLVINLAAQCHNHISYMIISFTASEVPLIAYLHYYMFCDV